MWALSLGALNRWPLPLNGDIPALSFRNPYQLNVRPKAICFEGFSLSSLTSIRLVGLSFQLSCNYFALSIFSDALLFFSLLHSRV